MRRFHCRRVARPYHRPGANASRIEDSAVREAVGCVAARAGAPACRRQSRRRCLLAAEVEIAPRVKADLPQLFGLAKVTFAGLPGWSDERVLEVLKRNLIFVAREQGQPAGYVALHRQEGGVIVVEQLFVAPGHEQRGIGHRLLAHAEGYAITERARSLQVVVEEGNQKARSFYRRSGFVQLEPELFELILPSVD
jgi:GNAT superfamily N-acetyltransferase